MKVVKFLIYCLLCSSLLSTTWADKRPRSASAPAKPTTSGGTSKPGTVKRSVSSGNVNKGPTSSAAKAPSKTYDKLPKSSDYAQVPGSRKSGTYDKMPKTSDYAQVPGSRKSGTYDKMPPPNAPPKVVKVAENAKTMNKIATGASTISAKTLKARKKESAAELKSQKKAAKP